MKTAISLPDELFRQADRLARKLGKSRSQLYQEALAEYVRRLDADSMTEAMNAVCDEVDARPDPWLGSAARRALHRGEW